MAISALHERIQDNTKPMSRCYKSHPRLSWEIREENHDQSCIRYDDLSVGKHLRITSFRDRSQDLLHRLSHHLLLLCGGVCVCVCVLMREGGDNLLGNCNLTRWCLGQCFRDGAITDTVTMVNGEMTVFVRLTGKITEVKFQKRMRL